MSVYDLYNNSQPSTNYRTLPRTKIADRTATSFRGNRISNPQGNEELFPEDSPNVLRRVWGKPQPTTDSEKQSLVIPVSNAPQAVKEEVEKVDNIVIRFFKTIGRFFQWIFSCGSNPESSSVVPTDVENGLRSAPATPVVKKSKKGENSPVRFASLEEEMPLDLKMDWKQQSDTFNSKKKAIVARAIDAARAKADFLKKDRETLDSKYKKLLALNWLKKRRFTRESYEFAIEDSKSLEDMQFPKDKQVQLSLVEHGERKAAAGKRWLSGVTSAFKKVQSLQLKLNAINKELTETSELLTVKYSQHPEFRIVIRSHEGFPFKIFFSNEKFSKGVVYQQGVVYSRYPTFSRNGPKEEAQMTLGLKMWSGVEDIDPVSMDIPTQAQGVLSLLANDIKIHAEPEPFVVTIGEKELKPKTVKNSVRVQITHEDDKSVIVIERQVRTNEDKTYNWVETIHFNKGKVTGTREVKEIILE